MNIQFTTISPGSNWPSAGRLTGSSAVLNAGDASRLVLYVSMHDVVAYKRDINDLVLVLRNGQTIRLDDFFRDDANGQRTLALVAQRDKDGVIGADEGEREHLVEVKFHEAQFGDSFQGSLSPTFASASFAAAGVGAGAGFAPALLGGLALGGIGLVAAGGALGGKREDTTAPDAPSGLSDSTGPDGRVTVKGKTEPGAKVKVKWPDGSVSEDKADGNGDFEITSPNQQPKGDINVSATDDAGNTGPEAELDYDGQPSDDKTAPVAPSNLSVSDNPDGTVTVTGKAEAGSTVKVTFLDGSIQEVTADRDGTFTATSEGPQRNGDIKVSAEDASNNTSSESTVYYEDGMRPAAPSDLKVTGNDDGSVTVTGKAEPHSTVKVTFPDESTTEVVAGKDGAFSVSSPKGTIQPEGDVKASATDINGKVGDESQKSYNDTTGPLEPTDLKVEDNGDGTVTVTGKAESGSTVKVTFPDGSIVEGKAGDDGSFSVDSPAGDSMIEGWVEVQPKDIYGNEGTVGKVEYKDTIAPPPPELDPFKSNAAAPVEGDSMVRKLAAEERAGDGDVFTNNREVEFTGKGGEPGGKILAYIDGKPAGTFDVDADGRWAAKFSLPDEDGTYEVTFTQKDASGNESDPSEPREVTLDRVSPEAADAALDDASDSGTKGDWVTTDDTPTLDFAVQDDASSVFVRVDGGKFNEVAIGGNGRVSYTLGELSDGQHRIEYYTVDRAGNKSEISNRNFSVVPEPDTRFDNYMNWDYDPNIHKNGKIWDSNGDSVGHLSAMWYSYGRDYDERMSFTVRSSSKIVDGSIYVNGVKVDDAEIKVTSLFQEGYRIEFKFQFEQNGVGQNIRIGAIDEYGHETVSNLIKFQVDPIAIDLDGDGIISTTSIDNGVVFDIDGDGRKNVTSWVGKKDGFLVYDGNDNGRVDGASELFGPNPELRSGKIAENAFQNLAEYDSNRDGVIDAKDAAFDKIKVWQDKNQNGISDSGEVSSLKELGIKSIGVDPSNDHDVDADANGVGHEGRSQVEYEDGRTSSVEGLIMDSQQDNLAGDVLEYSTNAAGESVMEIIKDGADIDMGSLQTKAMPDVDVLVAEGRGANEIKLDEKAIKELTHGDNRLRIEADESDTIEADGAVLTNTGIRIDGDYYNEYAFGDTIVLVNWEAQVLV